jgi:hypothetical protein
MREVSNTCREGDDFLHKGQITILTSVEHIFLFIEVHYASVFPPSVDDSLWNGTRSEAKQLK